MVQAVLREQRREVLQNIPIQPLQVEELVAQRWQMVLLLRAVIGVLEILALP